MGGQLSEIERDMTFKRCLKRKGISVGWFVSKGIQFRHLQAKNVDLKMLIGPGLQITASLNSGKHLTIILCFLSLWFIFTLIYCISYVCIVQLCVCGCVVCGGQDKSQE